MAKLSFPLMPLFEKLFSVQNLHEVFRNCSIQVFREEIEKNFLLFENRGKIEKAGERRLKMPNFEFLKNRVI